jgi:hypothetical protein
MATGPGRAFSIGGAAGIIAFLIQVLVQRPAGARLGKIAAAMSGSPAPEERQRLGQEADRLRRRNGRAVLWAVIFGLIAATAMSIARYV